MKIYQGAILEIEPRTVRFQSLGNFGGGES